MLKIQQLVLFIVIGLIVFVSTFNIVSTLIRPPRGYRRRGRIFDDNNRGREFQMLKFYFNGSPNPTKVALFLEEAGLAYEPVAVDTRKGDQFTPE